MRVERLYGLTKPALTKPALTKPALTKPALTKPAAAVCGSSAYMAQIKHLASMGEVGMSQRELKTLTKPALTKPA